MVVAILGEGCGRATILVQPNALIAEFDLVQPLLTGLRGRAQGWSSWWQGNAQAMYW
jgi:hypothetical protein